METNSILQLIEILKSQYSHYTEVRDTLLEEKQAVTSWNNKVLLDLNSRKEQLAKKERLLEEARNTLANRIQQEYQLENNTVTSIIEVAEDKEKTELIEIKSKLLSLTTEIKDVTMSLKAIYTTNLKIINDIKAKLGFVPANKYGMEKSTVSLPQALQITG